MKAGVLRRLVKLLLVGEVCIETNPHTFINEFNRVDSWQIFESGFDGQSCLLRSDAALDLEDPDFFVRWCLSFHRWVHATSFASRVIASRPG